MISAINFSDLFFNKVLRIKMFNNKTQKLKEIHSDQYTDVADLYDKMIGSVDQRTAQYKRFFAEVLKNNGCVNVLDAACGTGVDSMILLEAGFKVVSVDASRQMLKYARKNRDELKYLDWTIEEGKWQTLPDDIRKISSRTQYDAVICLANSFSHLLDDYGDQREQMMCLQNLADCVKPGGLLIIDHRNYDAMFDGVPLPKGNVYYDYQHPVDIKSSMVSVRGKSKCLALDFCIDTNSDVGGKHKSEFRLCYYPHKLDRFTDMLDEAFDHRATHDIYADFQPMERVPVPGFYIHVMKKHY